MAEINKTFEQYTAGPQAIGFDYQFYYLMYLSLKLTTGQRIGFEVKDDVHIDNADGTTILFQAKHSSQHTANGTPRDLADLDSDLWKTLSNWSDFIISNKNNPKFLNETLFHLVTNKNGNNNSFIKALTSFKASHDIEDILKLLNDLYERTENKTIKAYLKKIKSLGKRRLKHFFMKLELETSCDQIIEKIRNRIHEIVRQERYVDSIYERLYSNLQQDKYFEIKEGGTFEITYEDFNKRYGKCFQDAYVQKPLPKRNFPILLPDELENQTFIRQLVEIGEVEAGSPKIAEYTTQMLKVLNHFIYWRDNEFLLPSDISEFEKESFLIWEIEFRAKYRRIERRIKLGEQKKDLEDEIKDLGCELVDKLRLENFKIEGRAIGVEFSNGHLYALSDRPEIGWHYDWESKYK